MVHSFRGKLLVEQEQNDQKTGSRGALPFPNDPGCEKSGFEGKDPDQDLRSRAGKLRRSLVAAQASSKVFTVGPPAQAASVTRRPIRRAGAIWPVRRKPQRVAPSPATRAGGIVSALSRTAAVASFS